MNFFCPFLLTVFLISCSGLEEDGSTRAANGFKAKTIITLEDDEDVDIKKEIVTEERQLLNILRASLDDSDPMFLEYIVGDLGVLHYTINDTTAAGTKTCVIDKFKMFDGETEKDKKIQADIVCSHLKLSGVYKVDGQVILVPVHGNGDYVITADDYLITIDCDVTTVTGNDGKDHFRVKTFTLALKARGPVVFRLNNLFNGNERISNAFHRFANKNYRAVADIAQDPLLYPGVKIIMKRVNKYLSAIPAEEIIIQELN